MAPPSISPPSRGRIIGQASRSAGSATMVRMAAAGNQRQNTNAGSGIASRAARATT